MDKASAFALADRLRRQLTASPVIRDVQPQQLNPLNGDPNLGWGVRVYRLDGDLDIYGSEKSGYSTMQQTGGFMPLERLVVEKVLVDTKGGEEESPPGDDDLIGRLTRLSVAASEIAVEARAVRDEIALRANR